MAIPRARTDLARLGAWSAAIGHAPRVLGGAAVTNRRAQLIKEIFWMGVTLTPAAAVVAAEVAAEVSAEASRTRTTKRHRHKLLRFGRGLQRLFRSNARSALTLVATVSTRGSRSRRRWKGLF